jgi:hydroxymethylpyrimidine/phosphomethylpyrimidine kinase
VLAASAGGDLLVPGSLPTLVARLLPLASVLTPNLPEAARLLKRGTIEDREASEAARALLALGCGAVLLKGGHGGGREAVDWLATSTGVTRLALPRLPGVDPHGTGCALSASLAAFLGRGFTLEEAAGAAKDYVHRALVAGQGGQLRHDVPCL